MSKFFCVVIFLTTILTTIISGNCSSANEKCVKQNSCLCISNEYGKINISSVLDSYPYLEDTHGNITYYFLGCEDNEFKLNSSLKGSLIKSEFKHTTVNNTDKYYTEMSIIGKASSIKFEFANDQGDYQLVYNETGNSTTAYPTIRLLCTTHFDTPFLKIIKVEANELLLSSPKVCLITEHHGLSGGTIFLIILFVFSGIYFFGGGLFLYFMRGARDIEMIPNIDFWKNLPGLVKDGAIFLFSGCKPTLISTAETYDRI